MSYNSGAQFRFGPETTNDQFWSGQAVTETKFAVADGVARANSKLNQDRKKIGSVAANPSNTGVVVNYLVFMDKSEVVPSGNAPPVVFDSLTGLAYKEKEDTKWSLMDRLMLVGRSQTTVRYEGTVPNNREISVQTGGLGPVRLFLAKATDVLSWGARLCWTVPDISGEGLAAKETYRYLNGLARQDFAKGKVPVLVEECDAEAFSELPVAAFRRFIKKTFVERNTGYHRSAELKSSQNPLDVYIRTNFVPQAFFALRTVKYLLLPGVLRLRTGETRISPDGEEVDEIVENTLTRLSDDGRTGDDAAINDTVLMQNLGLLPWHVVKEYIDPDFVRDFEDSGQIKPLQNIARDAMAGQYAAFAKMRERTFGTLWDVARSGSAARVHFKNT